MFTLTVSENQLNLILDSLALADAVIASKACTASKNERSFSDYVDHNRSEIHTLINNIKTRL